MSGPHQTADAERGQKILDWSLLQKLWPYVKRYRWPVAAAILLAPLITAFSIAGPYLFKIGIDEAIGGKDYGLLMGLAGLYLAAMLGESFAMYGQLYALQLSGQRVILDLRAELFGRLTRQSRAFFGRHPSGSLLTRLTGDLDAINEMFAAGIVTLVTDVIKLAAIMGVMVWMNPRLSLVTFAWIPPLLIVGFYFRSKLRIAYREIRKAMARLTAFLAESINGVAAVQASRAMPLFEETFARLNSKYRHANLKSIHFDAAMYAIVEMFGALAVAAIIWYGGGSVVLQGMTFGQLVAFISYIEMFFEPIRDLSQKYAVMQGAMASAERIFGLLEEPVDIEEPVEPEVTAADREAGNGGRHPMPGIDLERIGFAYPDAPPVFEDLSLSIEPGRRIAIVGATGSGKTTIARLIQRLYDVKYGNVRLAQHDVRAIELAALRARIAVVPQDSFLFTGTLRYNLVLHEPISEQEVEQMCRAVDLLGRFHSLDFEIIEGGKNVSAGERQLIALARALLRKPEVLILDEATANVDASLEGRLYETAKRLAPDVTLISIAHRLSTVQDAHTIYVFHYGQMVEHGTHDALMASGGIYYRLMRLQTLEDAA